MQCRCIDVNVYSTSFAFTRPSTESGARSGQAPRLVRVGGRGELGDGVAEREAVGGAHVKEAHGRRIGVSVVEMNRWRRWAVVARDGRLPSHSASVSSRRTPATLVSEARHLRASSYRSKRTGVRRLSGVHSNAASAPNAASARGRAA